MNRKDQLIIIKNHAWIDCYLNGDAYYSIADYSFNKLFELFDDFDDVLLRLHNDNEKK